MANKTNGDAWDVIIIGAGIAGCGAGALLAEAGKKVLILEKGDIGGRCRVFTHKGHTMDLGGHVMMADAVDALYRKLGLELKLGEEMKGLFIRMDGQWTDVRELYFKERDDLRKISEELLATSWEELEKLDDVMLLDWLRARTQSEGLVHLLGMCSLMEYALLSYEDIPASEALFMRKLSLMTSGAIATANFPLGGFIGLVQPLAECFKEKGGQIRTQSTVREIVVRNGMVCGVEVEEPKVLPNEYANGELLEAPVVICTLPVWDLPKVLPKDQIPQWYLDQVKYVGSHRDCFLGFWAAVDKPIIGREFYTWQDTPRAHLPGGAQCYSAYDPALAPEGEHLILAGASCAEHAEWLHDKDWMKVKTKEMEADMEEFFPELKDHCLWKRWFAVDDYALLQKPGLVGSIRPGYEIPGAQGAYFASDTAHTRGLGTDGATRSAISVVERILGRKYPEFERIFHY